MRIPFLALLICYSMATSAQVPVGVQLYSFRNQFKENIPQTLRAIKEMGIKVVEGGDSYGMDPAVFKKLLQQEGIEVASIGADFQQLRNNIQSVIDNAKFYGATYVVCFWIPHKGQTLTPEEAVEAAAVFNEAGTRLRQSGLSLCYHPHGFEFDKMGNGTVFDHFVSLTQPEHVNFEMDVFWIKQTGQDPLALLKKYPTRFKLMHLKDRKPGTPDSHNGQADVEVNVTLGQGDVGIEALVQEARRLKLDYLFIEDESSRSLTQVPESLRFLKRIK